MARAEEASVSSIKISSKIGLSSGGASTGHLSAKAQDFELSEFDNIAGVDLRNHISAISPYLGMPQFDIIACPNVFEETGYSELSHLSRIRKLQEPRLACSH